MPLQQMEIKVGVPYKGNGVLNEYGQWMFTPAQIGSREGQKNYVKGEGDYTIYTTKKKVIIHISFDRDAFKERFCSCCECPAVSVFQKTADHHIVEGAHGII